VKEIDGISDPEIKYQAQRELAFSADNGWIWWNGSKCSIETIQRILDIMYTDNYILTEMAGK
jgi:hypothetical protein